MTGAAVLVGLLEAIIDREADRVERVQGEVDKLSQTIFGTRGGAPKYAASLVAWRTASSIVRAGSTSYAK